MSKSWYKKAEAFGLDPFGEGILTDKVRVSPYGHAGGEQYSGILEPSDRKTHANDYFGGDKGQGTIEEKLKKKKKKKNKKRRPIKKPIKKAFNEENMETDENCTLECDEFDNLSCSDLQTLLNNVMEELGKSGKSSHHYLNVSTWIPMLEYLVAQCPGAERVCDIKALGKGECDYEQQLNRGKEIIDGILRHLDIDLQSAINGNFETEYKRQKTMKPEKERAYLPFNNGLSPQWYRKIREMNTAEKEEMKKMAQWGTSGPSIPTWGTGKDEDWVSETYQKLMPQEDKPKQPYQGENKESIDVVLQSTVTINSFANNQSEIGSGFFINNNTLLTCAHVALPNFSTEGVTIQVKFGEQQLDATLWAYDSALDVAAIIINDPNFSVDKFLKLANSSEINPGDSIITIGTPLGFENVVQQGIVSSTPQDYMEQGETKKYIFISTNISPGNSGGPVTETINNSVVGIAAAVINSADATSQGLNAAIPIDLVKNFLKENGIKFEFQKTEKTNEQDLI